MTTARAKKNTMDKIKDGGEKAAKDAAYSPLMDRLTRLGYAIKGLIYLTIGVLGLGVALGKSSTPADQLGAISAIAKLPFGPFVLWVVLAGLVSYTLWGIIRALLDPFHKGTDTQGLLQRGGYLISGLTYASFVLPTYRLIQGAHGSSSASQTPTMIARVMSMPWGRWVVGILGLAIVAGGIYQIAMAVNKKFQQQFKAYALTPDQVRAANQLGRFGTAARGVVFALAGFFVVLAAYLARPGQARGIDGALRFLAKQPYGLWLLGIVAVGFIAFGVYSMIGAAWFRLKPTTQRR